MNTVDVSDLPEQLAEAVKAVAETFRRQLSEQNGRENYLAKSRLGLTLRPLGVVGKLTRKEKYDDQP